MQPTTAPFQFDAPAFTVTKSYRGENGEMFIEGVASTVDIDQTGERMSPEVIAKMAARLIGCPLREEHQKGYLNRLGEIVKADVVSDANNKPALWIKAKLHDWSSAAKDTFNAIKDGIKLGLSVAGRIKPGGLVKQLDESIGKFVPTYIDVEPTEVSVTDHPANLATFALAVSKSLPDGFMAEEQVEKDVTNVHETKPKEYQDVDTADFLDPEHFKYPVDARHLMPALRYFNQSGQRGAGGYSDAQWATMGRKLASKLTSATGDTYHYDAASEQVTQHDTKKTEDVKEVSTMKKDKGNLVSKQYNQEVKDLLKQFGKTVDDPQAEQAAEQAPAAPEAPAAPATPAAETPVGEEPAGAPAEQPDGDQPAAEDGVEKSTSTIESLLSDIASSLSTLTSSMSSGSSDSSTSSGHSSSSTSTPSTSTNTSTTSTDKAADSSSDASSSDDDSMEACMTSMGKAIETMKQLLAKRKSSSTSFVPGSSTSTPTSTSTSSTSYPSSTSTSTDTTTSKSLDELKATVLDIKKAVDEIKTKAAAMPQRKGVAIAMEKKFEDGAEPAFTPDPDVVAKMQQDKRVTFRDLHDYRTNGQLPKGW